MKSIDDTLKTIRDITKAIPLNLNVVLVGGVAIILHGIERTTIDVDLCIHTDSINHRNSPALFEVIHKYLPERFSARLAQGSKIADDPFKHDVIFIDDIEGEYERIDLLIARYKWALEGMENAEQVEGVPFLVLSKPYLAAMKLQAAGFKDAGDVVGLISLMTSDEKVKTVELAKRTGKDKKLERLLAPPEEEVREMPEEYL
jgi:hypothetical protein